MDKHSTTSLLCALGLGVALTGSVMYLNSKSSKVDNINDDEIDTYNDDTAATHTVRENYVDFTGQIPAVTNLQYTTPSSVSASNASVVVGGAANRAPPVGGLTPEQAAMAVSSIQPVTAQLADTTTQRIELAKPELIPFTFPLGDIADPANNIVYDRQITAQLKPVYRNTPDYIRGDIYIPPRRTGLFDPGLSPLLQLNQGALLQMGDISSAVQLQDLMYERNLHYDSFETRANLKAPYSTQYERRSP